MAAAAVLLIVVLGGLNLVNERRASDAEARASVLRSAIAVSLDPNSQVAGLHGSGVAAGATGFAAFPKTGTGYIVVNGLPQVTSDKTYQAWFVTGGTAHSAGLLMPGSDGLSVLQGVAMTPGAELVALTIEPAGGMPSPTTDPIVVGEMQPGPVAVALPKLGSLSGG
jgi:anti-sigma-K factor RskA